MNLLILIWGHELKFENNGKLSEIKGKNQSEIYQIFFFLISFILKMFKNSIDYPILFFKHLHNFLLAIVFLFFKDKTVIILGNLYSLERRI